MELRHGSPSDECRGKTSSAFSANVDMNSRGYTSLEFRREAQAADRNVEDVSKQNVFKATRLDEIRAAREKTEPGVIQS